jgi:hypothetical protein
MPFTVSTQILLYRKEAEMRCGKSDHFAEINGKFFQPGNKQ